MDLLLQRGERIERLRDARHVGQLSNQGQRFPDDVAGHLGCDRGEEIIQLLLNAIRG